MPPRQKWLLEGVEAEQMAFLQAFATDGAGSPSSRDPFPGHDQLTALGRQSTSGL